MKTGLHSDILFLNYSELNGEGKKKFHCNIPKAERVTWIVAGWLAVVVKVFLSSGSSIIIKTFTIVPLIKPRRAGAGLINTSYSGDYCLFRLNIDSKHPGSILM